MKLTPANSTRTSASPSPGKPPAAFSTERTSGPPNLDTLTTRTCSHPFLPLIAPRPRLLAPDCQRKSAPPIADKRHPWVSTSRNRHERQLEDDLQVIISVESVSYTHLRAHETKANLVCRLLLEKKKKK